MPYTHTTFVQNPRHGRKLYADEVHDDMYGMSNQFTATPTVNKYARSAESATDIHNLPPLRDCDTAREERTTASSGKADNQTINKRLLTTDSLYDLHAIPCPFRKRGTETLNKRAMTQESICDINALPSPFAGRNIEPVGRKKRRDFSEDSRYDLDRIPDPFVNEAKIQVAPQPTRSNYAAGVNPIEHVSSYYAFDYPPHASEAAIKVDGMPSSHHSHHSHHHRHRYVLPDSAYDYTAYGHPYRQVPTHSDYDYSGYAQPYMQPAYYYPPYYMAPFSQPPQANPFGYQYPPPQYPPTWYGYPPAPMQHMGPPPNMYRHHISPMPSSHYSDADTFLENSRIPNQFIDNPRRYRLRRPTSPDNETLNKYNRDLDSLQELHNLNINFDGTRPTSSSSSGGSNYPYQLRDFCVDSIREISALPSMSAMSLYNVPTRDVFTATEISDENLIKVDGN